MTAPAKDDLDTSWGAIAATQIGQLTELFGPSIPGSAAAAWFAFWGRQAERLIQSLGRFRTFPLKSKNFEETAEAFAKEVIKAVATQRAIMKSHDRVAVTIPFGQISQFAAQFDVLRDRAIKEDNNPPVKFPKRFSPTDMGIVAPTEAATQAAKKAEKAARDAKAELEAARKRQGMSASTLILLGIGAALLIKRL